VHNAARETLLHQGEYDLLLEKCDRIAPMKILPALIATCLLALAVSAPAAEPSKESEREQQQLLALVKEVENQQAAIAENQKKIDAKLAAIAEALRLARIYSSRSG
jgi:uncharacterized protein YlxW (UPF0749 family)